MTMNGGGGFKRSYTIPGREVTPMEVKLMRDSLAVTLVSLLKNDGKVIMLEDAVVRDGLPNNDFGVGTGVVNEWITGALTADTALTYVNNALANNKYAGFFGFSVHDATVNNVNVYLLTFQVGGTGGSTRGRYQPERTYAEQEIVGYFSDPVVYHPTETVFVQVIPSTTQAAGIRFPLFSLVAEPKGPFVS